MWVGKKHKVWVWTAVNHFAVGILDWVVGARCAAAFETLWKRVRKWQSYFYVTDGYKVYPIFVNDGDQIVSKTYMTRVEGENTRLRHYLAFVASQNTMLFQVRGNAEVLDSIATALPEIWKNSPLSLIHTPIQQRLI